MITVIIKNENLFDNKIFIQDKNDINHLKNSFRIKVGETIRAVDGLNEYICEVKSIEKKEIILEILEIKKNKKNKDVEITAGISIIKNDKMELVLQKLTEIGINKIFPLETKRTIVKLKEKKEKWDIVVKEATKQCQRIDFLEICDIKKLKEVNFSVYDLVVVPYEGEEEQKLKDIIKSLNKKPEKIFYLIGPEGGFDVNEIEYLNSLENAKIVSLGKNILRAETASIIVGGILINEFQ